MAWIVEHQTTRFLITETAPNASQKKDTAKTAEKEEMPQEMWMTSLKNSMKSSNTTETI